MAILFEGIIERNAVKVYAGSSFFATLRHKVLSGEAGDVCWNKSLCDEIFCLRNTFLPCLPFLPAYKAVRIKICPGQ
jgi:hypothetical protein